MEKILKFISFPVVLVVLWTGLTDVNASNKPYLISKDYCTLTMKFFNTDTVLVVSPDSCTISETDRMDIENYVNWEKRQVKPVYVYKTENEVNIADSKKHMLFFGCLTKFQRKEFMRIPLRKRGKGFSFENRSFNGLADAFFYINKKADKMYLCKNSDQLHHQFFAVGATGYPLHIFRGNEIVLTGVFD
ncbi:hypothetical protein SDC9_130457 [bioreactor metagenome]|uniref:Uncharacterized protein n=1 Tax=bioreactor metagenome TaxID=1076179 RepID=A0A645D2R7_9ZZZZ|nr:hypothetical protein [Paludibacter sp.]